MISEIWAIFNNSGTEDRDFTRKKRVSRLLLVVVDFTELAQKNPISRARGGRDTVKKEGP